MEKYISKITIFITLFVFLILIIIMSTSKKHSVPDNTVSNEAVVISGESEGSMAETTKDKATIKSSGHISIFVPDIETVDTVDDKKIVAIDSEVAEVVKAKLNTWTKDEEGEGSANMEIRNPFMPIDESLIPELEPLVGGLGAAAVGKGMIAAAMDVVSIDMDAAKKEESVKEIEVMPIDEATSIDEGQVKDADTKETTPDNDVVSIPEKKKISKETKGIVNSIIDSLDKEVKRPILIYTNRYHGRGSNSGENTDILRSIQQFNEDGTSVITKYIDAGRYAGNLDEMEYYDEEDILIKKEYFSPITEKIISVRIYRK